MKASRRGRLFCSRLRQHSGGHIGLMKNKHSRLPLIIKHKPTAGDEKELIDRCLKNDAMAQRTLFDQYAPRMLGICYRYASSREEAEDILQEGFIRVFENLGKFRREAALSTWITRVMINTALNHLNKHHKVSWQNDLEPVSNMNEYSDVQLHHYDAQIVMECIQQLPAGYRMVLNLYAIEGLSHKEIGEQLNIKEATSRSQFAKAKAALMLILRSKGINYQVHEARQI